MQFNQNVQNALVDINRYQPNFKLKYLTPYSQQYEYILLTGANGFLGVHLIEQLLLKNKIVYCGIRGDSLLDATNKLNDSLIEYGLANLIGHKNLLVVVTDLTKAKFGWDDETWENLSEKLDAILDNAAYVHHLQTYERMAPTNVESTKIVIDLATSGKLKRIHYISTKYTNLTELDAYAHAGMPSVCPPHHEVCFGYVVTKWASEWILWKAASNGVPVDIYRLGQITGDSRTGASNYQKNNFTHLILGCIQMGFAPDMDLEEDLIPVNQMAQAITALSLENYAHPNGWNVVNKNQVTYTQLFKIIQQLGYQFEIIPRPLWNQKLAQIDESNLLFPFKSYYLNESQIGSIIHDYKETYRVLDKYKIKIVSDYALLLKTYFKYWIDSGFFKLN